ncbi:MAG: flagellar hook-length control protein FliK [Thermodesulfobacteriota bacterium]|nr:flagellar hook-length control protein FliK [Thermodesulfobacteriota bacterium]
MISAEGTLPLSISKVFENLPKNEGGETTNEEFVQLLALLMGQYTSQDFISPRTIHLQNRENGHQLPFAGKKLPLPPVATPSEYTSKTQHRENDSALPEVQSAKPEQIHLRDLHQLFSIGSVLAVPGQFPGSTLVENTLETPFGHSAWDLAMGKKILFMVKQDVGGHSTHSGNGSCPLNPDMEEHEASSSGPEFENLPKIDGHQLPFAGKKLPFPPAATLCEHISKTQHRENDSALPEIQSAKPEQMHLGDLHQLFSIGSARAIPGQFPGSTQLGNTLKTPFGHSSWDHAMGKKILFMVKQDIGQAKIHLNPPELGRVEIKISVLRDVADVTFLTEHAGVKNALETAIPRLEAMFRDAGLNLMNVDISHHAFDGQHGHPTRSGSGSGPLNPDTGEHEVSSSELEKDLMQTETGLIDFYV